LHDPGLIFTLTGALAAALVLGWITQRLGWSTLVGYLLAGVVVGPHTPGFVADIELASRLAEIGVILLLFSVGMHFDVRDLVRVRRVAVPGAIAQSLVAAVAGWAMARAFGWSDTAGVVFGMSLAVASTAVLTRMLIDYNRLSTHGGHVAVGWLIVEDLFTVVALVALPALASPGDGGGLGFALLVAVGKAGAFALLLWALGSRIVTRVIERVARTRSEELFTLAVFVIALGIASLAAGVFQLSVALGAFFAGVVVARSRLGAQAGAYMTPFRDVFSALFFVSIGMLFDPLFVVQQPLKVFAATAIVLVAKPVVAWVIVRALRERPGTAETVSVALAQVGEFSFLLGALGVSLGILPQQGLDTMIAAALVSIAVNPLLFRWLVGREQRAKEAGFEFDSAIDTSVAMPETLSGHVIVAGEDPARRPLLARLRAEGIACVTIEHELDAIDALAQQGTGVFGDASRPDVLRAAGIDRAHALVILGATLPSRMAVALAARGVNPDIAIVVGYADAGERAWLLEFGVSVPCDTATPVVETLAAAVEGALASR
jgi:CPA2 family monovalent cation:H+ antiporter-2